MISQKVAVKCTGGQKEIIIAKNCWNVLLVMLFYASTAKSHSMKSQTLTTGNSKELVRGLNKFLLKYILWSVYLSYLEELSPFCSLFCNFTPLVVKHEGTSCNLEIK